jgi:lipopolysaccharide biosynthesis protein
MSRNSKISTTAAVKLVAMYFPQLHAIPENDEWWGEGFTDWVNVMSAMRHYEDHHQPRVPLNKNYYDQSELDTMLWQIDLAKEYGIFGFCHYHYWFDGKQLLETPTNNLLDNKHVDFPFCLSWANETWSRRWDARESHILIQQTHPPAVESWKRHFDYLIRAWTDERAIRVDNKPVFIIYRPHHITEINQMLDFWRESAVKYGLDGLYFIAQKQYEHPLEEALENFDAEFQFQPFESIYSPDFESGTLKQNKWVQLLRALPESVQNQLRNLEYKYFQRLSFHEYDKVWKHAIKIREHTRLTTYPGAFVDWDNTARYKKRATIFKGASPERFEYWFTQLVKSMPKRNLPENLIFINAWNEWAEGAYMEPDETHGFRYLEAVKNTLANV